MRVVSPYTPGVDIPIVFGCTRCDHASPHLGVFGQPLSPCLRCVLDELCPGIKCTIIVCGRTVGSRMLRTRLVDEWLRPVCPELVSASG